MVPVLLDSDLLLVVFLTVFLAMAFADTKNSFFFNFPFICRSVLRIVKAPLIQFPCCNV
jgi:hypothetical protein